MLPKASLDGRMWFEQPRNSKDLHLAVEAATENLRNKYGDQLRSKCHNMLKLYQGALRENSGVIAYLTGSEGEQLNYNVVSSCADTLISHVTQNRVRPMFLTNRGDWDLQRQAKGMQKAVEGQFKIQGVWDERAEDTARDGILFGLAATLVETDRANLTTRLHRLYPWEILYSLNESKKGTPRSIFVRHYVERSVMLDRYRDDAAAVRAILECPPVAADELDIPDEATTVSDQIVVTRAWHLPSGTVDRDDDAAWDSEQADHDGREIVCISGATLWDQPYPFEHFPIAFFRNSRATIGFRGRGLPEQLAGIQREIFRMMQRISRIMDLHAEPIIYLWEQARVNLSKLQSNRFGRFITGRQPAGQALQVITPQSVPAEYIAQLQRLIEFAYRSKGISELSATSKKPAGIESGIALQTLQDSEAIRFTPTFRSWEAYHVELAVITTDAFRALAQYAQEAGKDFEVIFQGDHDLEVIDWAETDVGEQRYRLAAWPTNLLPRTPAARLQRVMDLMAPQNGAPPLITPAKGLELLDFPDVESATADIGAEEKAVRAKIDAAIDGDQERAMPNAFTNLELFISEAQIRYQTLEAESAPEEILDRLRWTIENGAQKILDLQQQAAPPAPPEAPPMGPPAPPDQLAPPAPLEPTL